jgi:hypothetical protein
MPQQNEGNAEALFEQALKVAEKHLNAAMEEAGPLGPYVAVAMIEAAVNIGVEVAGPEDISEMLTDLAGQIEADGGASNDDEEDDED